MQTVPQANKAPAGPSENSHASTQPLPRLGGHILADALAAHGVDTIFGVPGESYLAVLDGLVAHQDRIRFVICRQEGGASFMADAYGKLTGKPGILMVTRGPGATNASIGLHSAHQDSTPLIAFIGQVGNDFVDREAFQEIDYRRMLGPLTKWVAQIDRADRIPEYVARAFQIATSGRCGPVALALPEDMLIQHAAVPDAPRYRPVQAAPHPQQCAQLISDLRQAKRPLIIVGGSGWTTRARHQLADWAKTNDLPVACAFRFQDLMDHRREHYCGDVGIGINPKLAQRIRDADWILALGPRLGEMTTSGYTLFDVPVPRQHLVHVHSDIAELGRVYQATQMINASPEPLLDAVASIKVDATAWSAWTKQARADWIDWTDRPALSRQLEPKLDPWKVVQSLKQQCPAETIVTNGAGNFATWANRFWPYAGQGTQLAPTSGAMGAGIPSAVAAKLIYPDRCVVCFAGDGDFLMTAQEFATAAQYDCGILVLVFNNGMYGTIRMHQEREYPARVSGTRLVNPDFAKYAEAFGGRGFIVESNNEFDQALPLALSFIADKRRPAVIELRIDPQIITPGLSIDQIRAKAQGPK
jgi:acetolactate synthase-1/2/3 large subunit